MKRVLIIEDEHNIRESLSELLELKGYMVDEAKNGNEGLQMASQNKPDIILCDVMMPGMNGHEVLTAIRSRKGYATVPFIFMTALAHRDDVREGMNLGADDYLTKPCTADELYKTIETRIEIKEIRDKERAGLQDPFQQDGIKQNIVEPIQGLRSSSEILLNHFGEYAKDEIEGFVQRLNSSLGKIERAAVNIIAAQVIELSNYDEKTYKKLTIGTTTSVVEVLRTCMFETASSWRRVQDIFFKDIPEFEINMPESTFKMIVSELLFNAFKFSKQGSLISVGGEIINDSLVLSIQDLGMGLNPSSLDILNRQEIQENALKGKYGLYVVKSLINRTNNSIKFESNKNQGTTVILTIK